MEVFKGFLNHLLMIAIFDCYILCRMITSVSWMPKEASNAMGVSLEPCFSKEEIKETGDEIQLDEIAQAKVVAKSFGKPCPKSNVASSSSADAGAVVNFMKELDMDNYDEEDDEIQLFSSCPEDLLYYPSNDLDPYLKNNSDDKYDSEELEDITIRPTDSLIISTSIEGPISYLKVYICEESVNGCPPNIYLRDDLIIPEAPFCTAWLDCPLKGGDKGNFVAIGSLKSSIDVWDLDLMDEGELPCVELGKVAGQTSDFHSGSVLGLAWNKKFRNLVASASIDKKVKVWDVATGQCRHTMEHHKDKVQAVEWNHHVPQVQLSGSCDRTVVLEDGRGPSHSGLKWSTKADVENLAWDPHCEHCFVVSLEDGTVNGFDKRASSLSPSFTFHAHDGEVCSISYNTHAPNLLATGSGDTSVKLWDLSNNQPSWIATHNPNIGIVFSVSFSAESPFLLAIGGSEGELKVWETLLDSSVSRRYGTN